MPAGQFVSKDYSVARVTFHQIKCAMSCQVAGCSYQVSNECAYYCLITMLIAQRLPTDCSALLNIQLYSLQWFKEWLYGPGGIEQMSDHFEDLKGAIVY